jgi:hypothetical protein
MSLAYFIVVNQDEPGFDTFVNGKAVAKQAAALNQLAQKLKVTPLDDFLSLGEDIAEEFGVEENVGQWFKAEEGLRTLDALIKHLGQNPKATKSAKDVLEDLREYQTVLSQVKTKDLQWRFEMDV